MLDYAAAPPSVGQSGPDLYMGGVSLSLQSSTEGGATTPHCDGACGFLKFWSINLTGNCSLVVLAPLPARAGCLSVGCLRGYFNMTGHEEPSCSGEPRE